MVFEYLMQAAFTVLSPMNLLVLMLAVGSGLIMGMLPGPQRYHGHSVAYWAYV